MRGGFASSAISWVVLAAFYAFREVWNLAIGFALIGVAFLALAHLWPKS